MNHFEDWEMESLKDLIYLQEEQMLLEKGFYEEMNRKPAKIVVIKEDDKTHTHEQINIQPLSSNT